MYEGTPFLISRAIQQISQGNFVGAMESLRQHLSEDPDHAGAHALLAITLYEQRRLHAAEHEAGLAAALDPESGYARYAMGLIQMGKRQFKHAEELFQEALALGMDEPPVCRALAGLYQLTGRDDKVLPILQQALDRDPQDASTLTQIGQFKLAKGDLNEAARLALEALQADAENAGAIVLLGNCLLRRNQVEEAREHAILALRFDPHHAGALALLASVKVRRNPLLGLWWRYSVWMEGLGTSRAILVLLAAFAVYRVVTGIATQNGRSYVAGIVQWVWLAIVVWALPAMCASGYDCSTLIETKQ